MSKASGWAKRLLVASKNVEVVMQDRPEVSASFYVSGFGQIYFAVDTDGFPLMYVAGRPHEIRFADDIKKLKESAAWIQETFGEQS